MTPPQGSECYHIMPCVKQIQIKSLVCTAFFFFYDTWQNNPVVGPWATTQNLSVEAQLKAGVRVLDFRCGYVGLDAQNYDHVADGVAIVHDKHRTSISLRQALRAVKQFVKEHPRYL